MTYEDIIYEERAKGVARITINRPGSYNAFRGQMFAHHLEHRRILPAGRNRHLDPRQILHPDDLLRRKRMTFSAQDGTSRSA